MTTFHAQDIAELAQGAALLGTGGGGDPHVGRLLAEQAMAKHGPVEVVDLADLPDDAVVIPVAMMGAPTVMVEKLPSADQAAAVVRALADRLGVTPTHLACIEAGGVNSTIPFVAAASLGLPLIDGDGMGRAFPELQMVLPTLDSIAAAPIALADEKGNTALFDTIDNRWAERLARSATVDMGCSTFVAQYLMSGAQCRHAFVGGTLTLCRRLGREVNAARKALGDPVVAVATVLNGRIVHEGKVTDVARRTTTGFARGEAVIAGTGADAGSELVLHFQNENLLAVRDGTAVVTTPDLIIVAETDSGAAITTEGLRYGQRVRVIAAPADPRWHSTEAIALVGPRYFGYDLDPVPAAAVAVAR